MMYNDLANRSNNMKLTRENFDIFFHLNVRIKVTQGLWAQEIFNRFDTKKVGYIEFAEFKLGICNI
jgi:hypothetical protein